VASAGDFGAMGTSSSTAFEAAQAFQVAAGVLTQLTFRLDANVGSPTGTLTWEVQADSAGVPGSTLQSGTISATPSANNTITVGSGVSLSASTTYWFRLYPTGSQGNGNYWQWRRGGDTYADGNMADRIAGSWTVRSKDLDFSVTTAPVACTNTPTPTPSYTPTLTFTPSNTPTDTPTFTPTFTDTPGPTPTAPTNTPTPTYTYTPTPTETPTLTFTSTPTFTASATPLMTNTPNLYGVITLTSGQAAAVIYQVSVGEMAIIVSNILLVILVIFGLFVLAVKR